MPGQVGPQVDSQNQTPGQPKSQPGPIGQHHIGNYEQNRHHHFDPRLKPMKKALALLVTIEGIDVHAYLNLET